MHKLGLAEKHFHAMQFDIQKQEEELQTGCFTLLTTEFTWVKFSTKMFPWLRQLKQQLWLPKYLWKLQAKTIILTVRSISMLANQWSTM